MRVDPRYKEVVKMRKAPRSASSYRAARRNEARAAHLLRYWHRLARKDNSKRELLRMQ